MSNINTTAAWEAIKTYLANFTHGLEVELAHIESILASTKPTKASKSEAAPVAENTEA